jgi:hypothetical protein
VNAGEIFYGSNVSKTWEGNIVGQCWKSNLKQQFVDSKVDEFADYFQAVIIYLTIRVAVRFEA